MRMNRPAFVLGVALLFLSAACSTTSTRPASTVVVGAMAPATGSARAPAPATEVTRPAAVPAGAAYVAADKTFDVEPRTPVANGWSPQLFYLGCKDNVLVIITSQILQLWASLPCDRMVPPNVVDRFLGQHVQVRVAFGSAEKLYVVSPSGGTLEFTITGAWAKE